MDLKTLGTADTSWLHALHLMKSAGNVGMEDKICTQDQLRITLTAPQMVGILNFYVLFVQMENMALLKLI